LRNGRWQERQIVPSGWIAASTRSAIDATLQDGYGYQWWVDSTGYYMALGYAGQFIFVIPDLDLVAVFVSELDDADFYVPQVLLSEYVVPAVRSNGALPENPEAVQLLGSRLQDLSSPE
jgi:CubicO group peptidase (beta-lactamase class C family)